MSTSYDRNIQRLQAAGDRNTDFLQRQNLEVARQDSQAAIDEAKTWATALSGFSETLHDWKVKDIAEKQREGLMIARKHKREEAVRLAEVSSEISELEKQEKLTKEQDTHFQYLKNERLKLSGESVYPEADRIANLSPWQQVGYAKEKLRVFNESFPDKLEHALSNSTKVINLGGMKLTPQQMRENNINSLPHKEAAVEILSEDIREAAGVNNFSPDMLRLSKVEDTVQKAKDSVLGKIRGRYNIEASQQTRAKALLEWQNSDKTAEDFHRLILINGNTIDENGKWLSNAGGLDKAFAILQAEGINSDSPELADHYGNMPLPPLLAKKLGVPVGTTFRKQWPGRFGALKNGIKDGMYKKQQAALKHAKTKGIQFESDFMNHAQCMADGTCLPEGETEPRTLTTEEVNKHKARFQLAGRGIPESLMKYETASMRNQRQDEQKLEALSAMGPLTNAELDSFHPIAAKKYRKQANQYEKELVKDYKAPELIKAALNRTFTGMGVKNKEKSVAYMEALKNAEADYKSKLLRYIGLGYTAKDASFLALRGAQGEAVDLESGKSLNEVGVLTEIMQNGESSKYTIIGQDRENSIPEARRRVGHVITTKRELYENPSIIFEGTFGGEYGAQQLDIIKKNIELYGVDRGLKMDPNAYEYYEGVAKGRHPREGGAVGLIDRQLKAIGHPGLTDNTILPYLRGRTTDDKPIPDPNGSKEVIDNVARAAEWPSPETLAYVNITNEDMITPTFGTIWDNPVNLPPYMNE
tara:strand:- start:4683 stop:6953 length:2271 start_codon:yes stop_codon:yes gene_type:complete